MYVGPSNSQVLRPPNTYGVSNGGVGSSIESPRKPLGTQKAWLRVWANLLRK